MDLYRLLVDQVQDYAIFALDVHGHVRSWNAGARQLNGYSASEIIGQQFSVFYPPSDIAAGKPAWELDVATTTGRIEDEGWRIRKDGSRFWANVVITALRDEHGELVGFAEVMRDLTDRRHAEEALRVSEERFRLLIQSVKDYAIFMLDAAGHVTTWNIGAERIKGYSEEEILGQHFSVFYPLEDRTTDRPERELHTAATTGVYEEEGWRIRKDGTRFWASVVLTSIRRPDGTLVGFTKVTRDLTERRRAEEEALAHARQLAGQEAARIEAEARAQELDTLAKQLELQKREADYANRTKANFLAAMSHELRTPLNAIGGYAQLLEMGVGGSLTDEQREQVLRIQRSQRYLLAIINDILNFSRIEAGQLTYDITSVPAHEVLESVGTLILPQVRAKHIDFEVEPCPQELAVYADRSKLDQIILNLVSNAVKFTGEGGTVTLTCGLHEREVWFAVRDDGIGIPRSQLDSIFEPFVQVGRNLANPKEGTGLGLAISRDLARSMHGDLTVESEEGRGSTFTLTLPAVHAD